MCSPGQTEAAQALCTSIPRERKRHHLQEGVGHYGVFAGARWESEIYPVFREFVADTGPTNQRPRSSDASGGPLGRIVPATG